MRFMVEFTIPTEYGNELVRSGKIEKVVKRFAEEFKPEAMYFYPDQGVRAGCIFVQSDDSSIGVAIGERLWFGLRAHISIKPVMNGEDLGKGLTNIAKIMENYA